MKKLIESIEDLVVVDLDGFLEDLQDPEAVTELFDLQGEKVVP